MIIKNFEKMLKVAPPSSSSRKNSRVRPPKYVYTNNDDLSVTEIVQSITNGLPIESIDPNLYRLVYQGLKSKRAALVQENNLRAICIVDNAMNEINLYYYKQTKKQELQKQREIERQAGKDQIEEEEKKKQKQDMKKEINSCVYLALNDQYDQIDPELYDPLAKELRKQQKKAIDQQNFAKAGAFDEAARRLLVLDNEIKYNQITTSRAQAYNQRVQTMRTDLSDLKYYFKTKLDEAKQKRDSDIAAYRKAVEEELAVFDQQFKEDPPTQYQKYSANYLNIRVQEKFLMKSKRFQEANELKAEADKIQAQEEAQFRMKYESDLEMKRNDLIRKLEEKIYAREEAANREFLKIQKSSQREIENANKALNHFENHAYELEQLATISNPTSNRNFSQKSYRYSPKSNYNQNMNEDYNGDNDNNMSRRMRQPPKSARAGPIGPPPSARTNRQKSRRSVRTSRDLRTPRDFAFERDSADIFRQRRAINNIMYTKRSNNLPSIRKSVS
ncbi:hypothetical protein TRFO_24134 [Tritrichomonas foetus]|uniref:Uncharacterized protein n=1 Tax=Tritrichomonas foetus TaxID=1144522 RepID=A0A1J4KDD4_9EUKA|nr:hypothetical protein TRFO_24134 [Tritrichomonas foetus]|eukprot:OHT07638.1 hypothetical protein TRFO_24134 [Tritrichomonas foetus]